MSRKTQVKQKPRPPLTRTGGRPPIDERVRKHRGKLLGVVLDAALNGHVEAAITLIEETRDKKEPTQEKTDEPETEPVR